MSAGFRIGIAAGVCTLLAACAQRPPPQVAVPPHYYRHAHTRPAGTVAEKSEERRTRTAEVVCTPTNPTGAVSASEKERLFGEFSNWENRKNAAASTVP